MHYRKIQHDMYVCSGRLSDGISPICHLSSGTTSRHQLNLVLCVHCYFYPSLCCLFCFPQRCYQIWGFLQKHSYYLHPNFYRLSRFPQFSTSHTIFTQSPSCGISLMKQIYTINVSFLLYISFSVSVIFIFLLMRSVAIAV